LAQESVAALPQGSGRLALNFHQTTYTTDLIVQP